LITVQNLGGGNVYVGTAGEEMAIQVPGAYNFNSISYVRAGTNSPVDLETLYPDMRGGAVISVDAAGTVSVTDGPDLVGRGMEGFGYGMAVLGVIIVVKWVFAKFSSALHLSPNID